MFLLTGTKCR